ncbi:hypothetical protein FsymDg_0241 [Candidatus Protofrankia datiscae]|uniref:Uncharacterized protein n=1 Tax=Candidatus Protofrankia datiscae TaxID=2716812 RepID=F8B2T8_9ACTN|nr:hypothetical protein FsymDg_0241 [Candidatus Protofrankia datiscae]
MTRGARPPPRCPGWLPPPRRRRNPSRNPSPVPGRRRARTDSPDTRRRPAGKARRAGSGLPAVSRRPRAGGHRKRRGEPAGGVPPGTAPPRAGRNRPATARRASPPVRAGSAPRRNRGRRPGERLSGDIRPPERTRRARGRARHDSPPGARSRRPARPGRSRPAAVRPAAGAGQVTASPDTLPVLAGDNRRAADIPRPPAGGPRAPGEKKTPGENQETGTNQDPDTGGRCSSAQHPGSGMNSEGSRHGHWEPTPCRDGPPLPARRPRLWLDVGSTRQIVAYHPPPTNLLTIRAHVICPPIGVPRRCAGVARAQLTNAGSRDPHRDQTLDGHSGLWTPRKPRPRTPRSTGLSRSSEAFDRLAAPVTRGGCQPRTPIRSMIQTGVSPSTLLGGTSVPDGTLAPIFPDGRRPAPDTTADMATHGRTAGAL